MNNKIIGVAGTALTAVSTSMTTNDVLETISLILTILGALMTFIIMPLINHFKHANEDGKITKDEVVEGVEILTEGATKVVDEIEKKGDNSNV